MKLDLVLSKIEYNVGEVSEFLWKSLGDCRIWAFNNIDNEEVGTFVVNKFGDVLALEVYHTRDDEETVCYRWIQENHREEYLKEDLENSFGFNEDEKTKFIDLDEEEDCLEKLKAIVNLEDFDSRISVVIDIDDSDFIQISKMAHNADITFNQQVNLILASFVDEANIKQKKSEISNFSEQPISKNRIFPPTILEVQEDETGELFLQFTPEMLGQLGWKEGDVVDFEDHDDGSFSIRKK